MNSRDDKARRPNSLRIQWTFLLSLVFCLLLSVFTLVIYNNSASQLEETYTSKRQAFYTYVTDKLYRNVDELSDVEPVEAGSKLFGNDKIFDEEVVSTWLDENKATLRIFNSSNQLIYSNNNLSIQAVPTTDTLEFYNSQNNNYYAGKSVLKGANSGSALTVEFFALEEPLTTAKKAVRNKYIKYYLILIVVAILASYILTAIFLRPLNAMITTLDRVEEDNLSQIRVKTRKSSDEWSDLNYHINRLLDKIDKFVQGQKEFVEDVSHELRTPVAIVEGHLKMLNRWGKEDPEILEESISASLQEITRMKTLIQEMLDLSRAEHAVDDYKDEITEIYSTTGQVYNNFVMLYPDFSFNLDIDKDSAGSEVYVRMFRNHYEQLLIILLDNAVKYSLDRKEIHIAITRSFSQIEIAVQDFGEGMSAEDKEKVFSRFYRVDKSRTREKGGTGLGLSIAWELVNSYKGKIRVESAKGQGSIFYINLPTIEDARELRILKEKQALRKM